MLGLRLRCWIVALTMVALTLPAGASQDGEGAQVTADLGTVQIVGGGPAGKGMNRWITSIQRGSHFCGASLIANRWVLTAAHCVKGEKAKKLKVWIGGHDLRNKGEGVTAGVKKIHIHPNYSSKTERNDIALLELKKPVGDNIPRAKLATAQVTKKIGKPGKVVTVSGWGALSENGASPKALHQVRVPVVSNSECNSQAAYAGEIVGTQLCAGLKQGGKDSCYGDSGGPLWASSGGKDHVLGIVSWGEGCAVPRKYGVYTRVSSFVTWAESKMEGGGDGGGNGGGGGGGQNPPSPPGNGNSCEGLCGGNAGNCWCDADCAELGDCCQDFAPVCGGAEDSCTTEVCNEDPYCCEVEWDGLCDELAEDVCQ